MRIGCFALVEPFTSFGAQLAALRAMGFEYADLTDNHDGPSLGIEYGFSGSVSLDTHPAKLRAALADTGVTLTSVCAHANLLDPTSPDVYGTAQIIKAVRLAALLGIEHVITTEGDPKTHFGHGLTPDQRIFTICEKLQAPIEWAEELGIELLLEPHGIVTTSVDGMARLLDELGHPEQVGICLDTGNSWLGGSEPIDFVRRFGSRIRHVHWKDMGPEWLPERGRRFGCGMGTIALGDGLINIHEIVTALREAGFDGATTLEVVGKDTIARSAERLRTWLGEPVATA